MQKIGLTNMRLKLAIYGTHALHVDESPISRIHLNLHTSSQTDTHRQPQIGNNYNKKDFSLIPTKQINFFEVRDKIFVARTN